MEIEAVIKARAKFAFYKLFFSLKNNKEQQASRPRATYPLQMFSNFSSISRFLIFICPAAVVAVAVASN